MTEAAAGPRSEPSAPPSTADHLRFHALHRPNAIALIADGHEITYRQFDADVRKFTAALREVVPPGVRSVALECDELYLHWLLILACDNLGLFTASLQGALLSVARPLIGFVDLVIAESEVPPGWAKAIYKLTQKWVTEILARPEPSDLDPARAAARRLADPTRIVRSSGTTGPGKIMLVSRASEAVNLGTFIQHMGFARDSRFLLTGPFNVGSMFWRATACLRLGATCVYDRSRSIAQAIVTYRPTHVRLFQYQARAVLEELPQTFRKPERLTVMMGAGHLPRGMRERILARLATDLIYTYNSNETWMMGVVDAEDIVTLRPGVDAEVIDEEGRPLPQGQAGRIKVRSDTLVDGYANDPEATRRVFRDGWFFSGDMGVMVGPRRLKVLGRLDDILNIGGVKILPTSLEDLVMGVGLVADAGVTSIPASDGIHEICIAVVPKAAASLTQITEMITTKIWPAMLGKPHVVALPKLPRTDTGKLQRHLLRAAVEEKLVTK